MLVKDTATEEEKDRKSRDRSRYSTVAQRSFSCLISGIISL